eukprot:1162796-Alexandrium_andersonii.AAC.1
MEREEPAYMCDRTPTTQGQPTERQPLVTTRSSLTDEVSDASPPPPALRGKPARVAILGPRRKAPVNRQAKGQK